MVIAPKINIVLDTTYLAVFDFDVDMDSSSTIQETPRSLMEKGVGLHISDLTPFEAFIKSYRISEKLRDEEGKEAARVGHLGEG